MKNIPSRLLVSFLSLFLLFNSAAYSGGSAPLWTKEMKGGIIWQKVTSLGLLVASTGKGLTGINTMSGEEMWVIEELKNCPENSYQQIPNSPFITMSSFDAPKSVYVVNPLKGSIVFSSKSAGLELVVDKYFLYLSAKILVIGNSKGSKNTEMVMVDMTTGTKLWSKSGAYSFTTGVKDLGNNEVLITSAFFASKINATSGEEFWKTGIDPKTAGMSSVLGMLEGFASKNLTKEEVMAQLIIPPGDQKMFVIAAQKKNESTKTDSKGVKSVSITYSSVYMAFETTSGKHMWSQVVELQHPLGISYAGADGLIVCSSSGGNINMLNYSNGSTMLGKKGNGLNLKGAAAGMAPLTDGRILVVSGNGNNSALTVLDTKNGIFTIDKAAKIKGSVTYTEVLAAGVLVGTDENVNLLNTATGEWYWEKSLEGGAGLIASDLQKIYVFNTDDNLLYHMDVNATAIKPLSSSPVVFQGKEKPKSIEITANGILISSDQNLALFDLKGTVTFNQYFVAPTISDFKKALLIASAVRAAYYTAAYATAFGAASQSIEVKDSQSKATKDVTANVSKAFGDATVKGASYTAAYIAMAQQRFTATTQAADYMLIMTAETKKDIRLLQVSKVDGKVMNTIQIGKDKDPIYDVDLVDGKLYYMKDAAKMECYKF
ncbi:MAG: PQQ-binding-like beta-propeller repeat protein [Bacteroidetes bacterium]|nr:PQQ-binding-like beta-propeller repeat protein [Bacteroidota bacterium]